MVKTALARAVLFLLACWSGCCLFFRGLQDPLMLKRIYRSQLLIGHVLLVLGVFMLLDLPRPSLWLLEDWGGFEVSPHFWAGVFGVTGFSLVKGHRVTLAVVMMWLAAIELLTVAAAAYLGQGPNSLTIMAGVMALHAGWTAADLYGLLKVSRRGKA